MPTKNSTMFDKILNTFVTRVFSMLMMFLVVIINTNTFGPEGTGTIALVILGLTLLQVLSNFVGGTSLVFLTPQKNIFQLLFLSYLWAVVSNLGGITLLYHFKLIPTEYALHLLAITLVYSVYYIHVGIIQGKEEIRRFNALQLLQVGLLLLSLAGAVLVCKGAHRPPTVDIYLYAFLFSYFVPAAISCFHIAKYVGKPDFRGMGKLLVEMLKLGFWTQIANLTQLLTYRLNYYLIEGFVGRKSLGLYELGTRISEAVWVFPKSICLVQYARISNNHEHEYAKNLTLGLFKIVLVFSLLAVLFLWALPASFIAWVFGPEFAASKPVICSLLPGVVFLACMSVLSHHFAGYGKYWINAVGSLIGLAVTAVLGFTWLPAAARIGAPEALRTAGWISSAAYFASFVFTLICFVCHTSATGRDFIITRADWLLLKNILHEKLTAYRTRKK